MAINITAKGDPEKKLKWAFKMYDVDGNGEIDKNEMLQIIQVFKKCKCGILKFYKINFLLNSRFMTLLD